MVVVSREVRWAEEGRRGDGGGGLFKRGVILLLFIARGDLVQRRVICSKLGLNLVNCSLNEVVDFVDEG